MSYTSTGSTKRRIVLKYYLILWVLKTLHYILFLNIKKFMIKVEKIIFVVHLNATFPLIINEPVIFKTLRFHN